MSDTYVLLDGKNTLWRAASVMEGLSVKGKPTGGIHGFLIMLKRVIEEYSPKSVVVCWDDWKEGPSFRKALVPSYKEKRGEMDAIAKQRWKDVQHQMFAVMEFLSYLGIKQVWSPGWEADDVMGTLARKYAKKGRYVNILTGDRDLLQCMTKRVHVLKPAFNGKLELVKPKDFAEDNGFPVHLYRAYKALAGDNSDGYGGCPGIGEKTAKALIAQFTKAELERTSPKGFDFSEELIGRLLRSAKKPELWVNQPTTKPRWAELLNEHEKQVELCLKLATINTKAPLKFIKTDFDLSAAKHFLKEHRMALLLASFSTFKKISKDWNK